MISNRLLVVRNDKLGDFLLAWPALALLKHYWPEAHITALVPEYTAPMAKLCPWIDELLIDEPQIEGWQLARKIRKGKFDSVLTLFSSGRVAIASLLAGIPYRLAPATKIAQLCYNHRLTQRRSHSRKPEYLYNIDLAQQLLQDFGKVKQGSSLTIVDGDPLPAEISRPLLKFDEDTEALKSRFCKTHHLDVVAKLIFIHPGSGGSANNLSIEQFSQLALEIARNSNINIAFVITAGPGEETIAQTLVAQISKSYPAILFQSESGIEGYARTLQLADLFISGSTGTLHIAGAMNLNTAGFYPRHRSATPLRWQTLNAPERRLAFTPPEGCPEDNLSTVDIEAAADAIVKQFL